MTLSYQYVVELTYYLCSLIAVTTATAIIVECGPLADPIGGKVILPTSSTVNSVATYNCDRDRTLFGSATRTCQTDRTWSGEEPECITPGIIIIMYY